MSLNKETKPIFTSLFPSSSLSTTVLASLVPSNSLSIFVFLYLPLKNYSETIGFFI